MGRRRKQQDASLAPSLVSDPTPERLAKSGYQFEVGDDKQGTRVYTFRDAPIERLKDAGKLSKDEYEALTRYHSHWVFGRLLPTVGAVDPNRVYATNPAEFSFLAKTERQVWHRQQFAAANEMLKARSAWKPSIVLDNVVINEQSLVVAGFCVGFKSEYRSRTGALNYLKDAASILIDLWGINRTRNPRHTIAA